MSDLFNQLFRRETKAAHAKILVQCPLCRGGQYIRAGVTPQMEVIEPNMTKQCRNCKKVTTLIRVEDDDPINPKPQ